MTKSRNTSGKNAIYLSYFSLEECLEIINNLIKKELADNLLAGSDFSLLSDESTDKAERTPLPVFARFIDSTTYTAYDKLICMRKLGESKTAAAIMAELFTQKCISKSSMQCGKQNDLQRKTQHMLPYALYINCHNHRLALCLVHLNKEYSDLQTINRMLLSIWKIFKYSSIK